MDERTACLACGGAVSSDEIAITKRLVNRGTTRFYCTDCLAEAFGITAEDIRRAVAYYKRMGCTLFR